MRLIASQCDARKNGLGDLLPNAMLLRRSWETLRYQLGIGLCDTAGVATRDSLLVCGFRQKDLDHTGTVPVFKLIHAVVAAARVNNVCVDHDTDTNIPLEIPTQFHMGHSSMSPLRVFGAGSPSAPSLYSEI